MIVLKMPPISPFHYLEPAAELNTRGHERLIVSYHSHRLSLSLGSLLLHPWTTTIPSSLLKRSYTKALSRMYPYQCHLGIGVTPIDDVRHVPKYRGGQIMP
jgi:hypothetical protein